MKKNLFLVCLFMFGTLASCQCSSKKSVDNAVANTTETPVPLGDPFILLHDGVYYAYGTHSNKGIEFYTSDDLLTWKYGGIE